MIPPKLHNAARIAGEVKRYLADFLILPLCAPLGGIAVIISVFSNAASTAVAVRWFIFRSLQRRLILISTDEASKNSICGIALIVGPSKRPNEVTSRSSDSLKMRLIR